MEPLTERAEETRTPALQREIPWCANPFVEWLLTEGRTAKSIKELMGGLCQRLVDQGVPLWRMYCQIRLLHPQVFATSYTWCRDSGDVEELSAPNDVLETSLHRESPCAAIFEGAAAIRRRLDIPSPRLDFPILEDLYAEGATDYAAMPLPFSSGQVNILSVAADRPSGFTPEELRQISEMLPVMGHVLEVHVLRDTAKTLLDTYLGRHTGERVLNGLIKRGDGEDIRAAIWFCDLRDSTRLAESMSRGAFLGLLNEFFDCMAGAVLDHGGEVLRFIGDAALAIFSIDDVSTVTTRESRSVEHACHSALAAAHAARDKLGELNRARAAKGEPKLRFGLALHMGEVTYGNIGVPGRLEFTVIGAAVNEAAKLESLSKKLDQPVLISGDFARCSPGGLISIGRHTLPGIARPLEVFVPQPEKISSLLPPEAAHFTERMVRDAEPVRQPPANS